MRSFFSRLANGTEPRLSIIPDHDYVFLSGCGQEAQGQYLRGKIRLLLHHGETAEGVQLTFAGRLVVDDHQAETISAHDWSKDTDFFSYQWSPFLFENTTSRPCGYMTKHEWTFEYFVPGHQEETMRGCGRCHLSYRLEAKVLHPKISGYPQAVVPIRVNRSPPLSSYDLLDPFTTQGKWSKPQLSYDVSIRHQANALGGFVPIDAQLVKFDPATTISRVRMYLTETHTLCDKLAGQSSFVGQRQIAKWPLRVAETEQHIHAWKEYLQLPRVVRQCSPDFRVRGLAVTHMLHFAVTVRLPDGAESEYETSMPITLFISQDFPVTGWDVFERTDTKIKDRDQATAALSKGLDIPPEYCASTKGKSCVFDDPPPAYASCQA